MIHLQPHSFECDSNCLGGNTFTYSGRFLLTVAHTDSEGSTFHLKKIKDGGTILRNFSPGQDIIFRNLGQGNFSDFPVAPPFILTDQVTPGVTNQQIS